MPYVTGDIFSLSEEYLDECVKNYSKIIKTQYDEDHIIVIEHYSADSYIDESFLKSFF